MQPMGNLQGMSLSGPRSIVPPNQQVPQRHMSRPNVMYPLQSGSQQPVGPHPVQILTQGPSRPPPVQLVRGVNYGPRSY